jgi:ribosomal protein L11 methyltransferase
MEDAWQELRWTLLRAHTPRALDALFALDCLGAQEDFLPGQAPPPRQPWDTGPAAPLPTEVLLRAWWPEDDDTCRAHVDALVARIGGEVAWGAVSAEDWANAWRDHFTRLVISDTLAVSPPWDAQAGDLIIEPGMAFGSGDHPTTRACLDGIVRNAQVGEACLDVGCGSGILALAAVKLGMSAVGIDIDADAVVIAAENAEQNGLRAEFSATPLEQLSGRYPLIVANVFAEVLAVMAPDLARLCSGAMVLAGILADRAELVEGALAEHGWAVTRRDVEGEWVSLELRPA